MINYLKDIKKETLIGQLPDIVNSNNESIRKEFDWYFDSSLNRLKRSVYAPTGSVKAHFGEFVNLSCEYLTIKNEESIKNSIQSAVKLVISDSFDPSTKQLTDHNILNNRFVDSQYEGTTEYVHDAASIVYEKENEQYVTIKDKLDNINATLNEAYDAVKRNNSSIINIENDIQNINSNIENIDSSIQGVYEITKQYDASIINIETDIQELNSAINTLSGSVESVEQLFESTNSSINTLSGSIEDVEQLFESTNSSVNICENDIQELNSAIDELSEDTAIISQSLETINSSIRKIDNSINNLSEAITNLEEPNSNKLIYDDTYTDVTITKNQYNFIVTPISDNEAIIEIKFDNDINHEYNFKFILNEGVETVYIHNDEWYNPNDDVRLYINCDNNTYNIDYSGDNSFIITREDSNNSAMCDITLNRYINENIGTTVCMLYCKVYNQYIPNSRIKLI